MKSEAYIVEQIIKIEGIHDPTDDMDYLDAEEQTSLAVLYEILDREFTPEEQAALNKARENEEDEEDFE